MIESKIRSLLFLRKIKPFVSKLFFYLFCFRKIKKNKIVFSNFLGEQYGCNPKYITEELLRQNLDCEIVWLVKKKYLTSNEFPKKVRLSDFGNTVNALKELSTAKLWIDNQRKVNFINLGLRKRKGQFYINTWHGSLGIKRLDFDVPQFNNTGNQNWLNNCFYDSSICDFAISNSAFETEVYKNGLHYMNVKEFGHPRNDILFNIEKISEIKNKIANMYNFASDKKIVLYAPSFRDSGRLDWLDIDLALLRQSLSEKFGEDFIVLAKLHPRLIQFSQSFFAEKIDVYDVTQYPDMQELMLVSDIMVSDYSSCMFDFMLTKKPVFVYANDIKRYNNERGFYYPMEETPFLIATTNGELRNNILEFDLEKYIEKLESFIADKKCIEDGNASIRVVELVKSIIGWR